MKPSIQLLKLQDHTIQQQLEIEEALLRNDKRNWCIIQEGVPPSIVLGISGTPEKFIDLDRYHLRPIPLLKRYSGGGTVVVDQNTLFVTFICQSEELQVKSCSDTIFKWSENFYRAVFKDFPFQLRERDYVFNDRKFGGNAQYLAKDRWVHHTSFLWDYDEALMSLLLMPQKRPEYRAQRSHSEFICKLKEYLSKKKFQERLENALSEHFTVDEYISGIHQIKEQPHRKGTSILHLEKKPAERG